MIQQCSLQYFEGIQLMKGHKLSIFSFVICSILLNQIVYTSQPEPSSTNSPNQQVQSQQIQESFMADQALFQKLNYEIETLSPQFIENFLKTYHLYQNKIIQVFSQSQFIQKVNIDMINQNPGNFLLLLAKMYLYDILPKSQISGQVWEVYDSQSNYLLAYFYLKIAAQKYQNSQAYYYLGILQYHKITPDLILQKKLELQLKTIQKEQGISKAYQKRYLELINHLKTSHLVNTQNNLYIASLLQHNGASLILANLNRNGIGMDKNCSTAVGYYMSIIKNTYVDNYEFRSLFSDQSSFQKQLFAKKKADFLHYGQDDISPVWDTLYFDQETIKTTYQIAENYFIGRAGFIKNFTKAALLYQKLAGQNHKLSATMLGMCYLKGQGVPLDRKRARLLFNQAKSVELAQSMLLTMDYFQIQSVNTKKNAINKMKQKYEKKRDSLSPTLKYLIGSLIVKGQIAGINKDEGLVLLEQAAASGHLMAKISMALIFLDGIDVSFDCIRASKYFAQEGLAHPFFIDKLHLAKVGIKKQKFKFSLIKYLELSLVGQSTSFVNGLYMLQIYQQSFALNQNSWNLEISKKNQVYKALKQFQIVPDIQVYFLKRYNLVGSKTFTINSISKFFQSNSQINEQYKSYMRKKIIRVGAVTKENSLIKFYQYKLKNQPNVQKLLEIANDKSDKLHVLQSRYLLGKLYHTKSYQKMVKGDDYSKQQYKALQEYKRSTKSQVLGKIIFYIQQYKLGLLYNGALNSDFFQFGIKNDLLTYTLILSIVIFLLYYKRSVKLDQIHHNQLKKQNEQLKIKKQQEQFKQRQQMIQKQQKLRKDREQESLNKTQPIIFQQREQQKGYRIGSSSQSQSQFQNN